MLNNKNYADITKNWKSKHENIINLFNMKHENSYE